MYYGCYTLITFSCTIRNTNIRQKTETKIGNAFVHSKLDCLPITFYFICATHNYTEIDCQNIKTNTLEL